MKKLIVTLSIGGDRKEFAGHSVGTMQRYADRIGASFECIKQYRVTGNWKTGRRNNTSSVVKNKILYDYLGKSERVLLLDDTCCVHPDAPDIFALVDADKFGAFNEGSLDYLQSHRFDQEFILDRTGLLIDQQNYVNGGVLCCSRTHRELFSDANTEKHRRLFRSKYPHQAYLNYMLQSNGIAMQFLDRRFNNTEIFPEFDYAIHRDAKRGLSDEYIKRSGTHIWHVTGYYGKYRPSYVREICTLMARP